MLRNYLTIAFRNLRRNVGYTAINVLGLAVGMTVCLLIVLYVQYELSYDRFHDNADRVYRLIQKDTSGAFGQAVRYTAFVQGPMGPTLERSFSEVQETVRLRQCFEMVVRHEQKRFDEGCILQVDPSIFDVFTFPLVEGNARAALSQPDAVVLTASTARKYFGREDPMGQTLTFDGEEERVVTGVVEDVPRNSHLTFDFLTPMPKTVFGSPVDQEWRYSSVRTYALLRPGSDPEALEQKLADVAQAHIPNNKSVFSLQPLPEVYLFSPPQLAQDRAGDPRYLYLFSAIALLIVFIACINYVNLATARATDRAKEVGVRKAVGAHRLQIARQFLSESMLISAASLALALVLSKLLLPTFSLFIERPLSLDAVQNELALGGFVGAVLGVGLLAGGYPALFLSRFEPTEVLKGRVAHRLSGASLRKGLVVFQFAVSVALIIGTAVIYWQLQYMQAKKLGLDEERVVVVPLESEDVQASYPALKRELERLSSVVQVTGADAAPAHGFSGIYLQPDGTTKERLVNWVRVDSNFLEAMGIQLVAGRDLSSERTSDASEAALVNEAAVRALGWRNPLGEEISTRLRGYEKVRVVGVVENFHFESLHKKIAPLVILPQSASAGTVLTRIQAGDVPATLDAIKATYERFASLHPFAFSFLDDDYDAFYRSERRLSGIFGAFAGIAVLIACLGLFGLAAYAAERRTKEIGIRKALGATMTNIVTLLSKDFLLLVGLACAVAVPVAYLAMERWLEDFAYRIAISPWLFVAASGLALAVALLTISYQAVRAARTDPVEALRYE